VHAHDSSHKEPRSTSRCIELVQNARSVRAPHFLAGKDKEISEAALDAPEAIGLDKNNLQALINNLNNQRRNIAGYVPLAFCKVVGFLMTPIVIPTLWLVGHKEEARTLSDAAIAKLKQTLHE